MFSRNRNWDNLRILCSFDLQAFPIFKPEWILNRKKQDKITEPTIKLNELASKTMLLFTGKDGNRPVIVSSFIE
jgi:hypothetical protein